MAVTYVRTTPKPEKKLKNIDTNDIKSALRACGLTGNKSKMTICKKNSKTF